MTYEQALAYWFDRANYEQRSPNPENLKLDRIRTLLRHLGDPQDRLRIIHVAGSKGKGSTSAMLAAILGRAGYCTGLFTSPHLCRVEERIQVDGIPISPEELAARMQEIQEASEGRSEEGETTLPPPPATFFEVATALGFLHFVRRQVEAAVVEVGLGGRFDSTNVCQPLVSLITSISFDHTQQLGNRLASIAMEKAGILKPERPAVSGVQNPEARKVIESISRQRGAPLRQLGVDFHYQYDPGQILAQPESGVLDLRPQAWSRRPKVRVVTNRRTWPLMELSLMGEHQAANAAVAVACVEELRDQGLSIPDQAVALGLSGVSWPARLEVMAYHPLVVLDCAHNVASAQVLVETLQTSFPPGRRLLVFAGSNDKDLAGILDVLAPHFAQAFFTRYANSPRSVPPEQLADLWRQQGTLPTACPTAAEALQAARAAAGMDDLICVTGSVFLAGELRPLLLGER